MARNSAQSSWPDPSLSTSCMNSPQALPAPETATLSRERMRRTGSSTNSMSSAKSTPPDSSASKLWKTALRCSSASVIFNTRRHMETNSSQLKWPEWSLFCSLKSLRQSWPPTVYAAAFKRERILATVAANSLTEAREHACKRREGPMSLAPSSKDWCRLVPLPSSSLRISSTKASTGTSPPASALKLSNTMSNCASSSKSLSTLRHIWWNSTLSICPEPSMSCCRMNCSHLSPHAETAAACNLVFILCMGSSTNSTSSSIATSPDMSWSKLRKTTRRSASASVSLSTFRHMDMNSLKHICPERSLSCSRKSLAQSLPPAV
mmetsp:Transcript_54748/g.138271  ORF Transcript_54748/g.138271 Transcript_54748/m.138271 type:complete len:321 (-) Transcript_54748:352-1314(-)